ncbi:MAG: FapA family protein [Thermodesulfobacteriota bacterium]
MKILLVDQIAARRTALLRELETEGRQLLTAEGVKDALAGMSQKPFAVILTEKSPADPADVDVPDLCRLLRDSALPSYVYIILISETYAVADLVRALQSGADVVIRAPADARHLTAQIEAGRRLLAFNESRRADSVPDHLAPPEAKPFAAKGPSTIPTAGGSPPPRLLRNEGFTIKDTTKQDRVLAKIAMANRFVTKKHLAEAFTIQHRLHLAGKKTPLDVILKERGMVSQARIDDLLVATKRRMGKRFGAIAIQKGYASQEQVTAALDEQAEEYKRIHTCRRLGDILVANSVITREQCDLIWIEQEAVEILPEPTEIPETAEEKKETEKKEVKAAEQESAPPPDGDTTNPFSLVVSPDGMSAHIIISPGTPPQKEMLAAVKSLLSANGVRHGIVPDDVILNFLELDSRENSSLLVAKGSPPEPGLDAAVRYYFTTDYLRAGKIREDGGIDYRERGERPRVSKGAVIAEKIPAQPGRPGIDILGNSIPPPETEDILLLCDAGALLSEDGLRVTAAIDGEPNLTKAGRISVLDELNIEGDVDYSTGNIQFAGNIHINGAVRDGFRVVGGNITAAEIFNAEIEASGNVTVKGGILGAKILSEGDVNAKFIDHANIKSFGSVTIQKEVRNSKIRASGEFNGERGAIISSYVAAKLGIKTKNIGTDVTEPCKIQLGVDENVRKRIQAYGFRHAEKTEILQKLQSEYETRTAGMEALQKRIADLAQIQDRSDIARRNLSKRIAELQQQGKVDELKDTLLELQRLEASSREAAEQLKGLFPEQEQLEAEISQSMEEIEQIISGIEVIGNEKNAILKWAEKNKAQAILQASGVIYAGTRIHGRQAAVVLKENVRGVTVKEVKTNEPGENWEILMSRG